MNQRFLQLIIFFGAIQNLFSQTFTESITKSGNWEINLTFDEQIWHEDVYDGYYDFNVKYGVNNKGEMLFFVNQIQKDLSGDLGGSRDSLNSKFFTVSSDGKLLAVNDSSFNCNSHEIISIQSDENGNFWICSQSDGSTWENRKFEITKLSNKLDILSTIKIPTSNCFLLENKMCLIIMDPINWTTVGQK